MPREIAVGDVLVPSLLAIFILTFALLWILDGVFGHFGLYRLVWHPPLFRVGLFVCAFGGIALCLF